MAPIVKLRLRQRTNGNQILRLIFSGASGKVPPDDTLPSYFAANKIVSVTRSWV